MKVCIFFLFAVTFVLHKSAGAARVMLRGGKARSSDSSPDICGF